MPTMTRRAQGRLLNKSNAKFPLNSTEIASVGLCATMILAFTLTWQINLSEQYSLDYDEGVYLLSARMAVMGNPLFSAVFSSQPPLFLEVLTLVFRLFGDSVAVGRATMIFFSLVSLGATAWIAWRFAGPLAGPLAILSLGLPIIFFQQARIVQAEMPALAFALLAIGTVLSYRDIGGRKWLVAGGVLFSFAALCKLLIVPLIVPILFLLTLVTGSHNQRWLFLDYKSLLFSHLPRRLLVFGLAGMLACLLLFLRYDLHSAYEQIIDLHLEMKSHFHLDRSKNFSLLLQLLRMELGVALLAGFGLIALFRKQPLAAVWLCLWIISAGLFLIDHSPLYVYHTVLFFPPLAVAASANVLWIPRLWKKLWTRPLILLLLAPLISAKPGPSLEWSVLRDVKVLTVRGAPNEEYEAINLIRQHTEPSDFVVSDQQMQIFRAGRRSPPELCDTSYARIKSGSLTDDKTIRASQRAKIIVFWTNRLAHLPQYRQWVRSRYLLLRKFDGPPGTIREIYLMR